MSKAKTTLLTLTGHKSYDRKKKLYQDDFRMEATLHLDEITLDTWLYLEALNDEDFHLCIADRSFNIHVKADGTATLTEQS